MHCTVEGSVNGRPPPPSLGGRRTEGGGGDLRSTGGAGPTPPPPRAVPGHQGSFSPLPPTEKAKRVGGKRTGQPRRPIQTPCDEHRAPTCKSCKGHRGVRHCYSRHHEAGARTGSLVRGTGWGSSRAGSSGAATRGHAGAGAWPREGLAGGHITRGGCPSAAPRHTGGARGGIGQATGRL